jgi:uncharacterized protein
LSELFEELPEVGDPDKPKLVFFFDEAHLLFDDAPKALVDKVEQVARLIRSKGVGSTSSRRTPPTCPKTSWGSWATACSTRCAPLPPGTRKACARRPKPIAPTRAFRHEEAIREVGTGEAVTSLLENKGIPGVVERTLIRPPSSSWARSIRPCARS